MKQSSDRRKLELEVDSQGLDGQVAMGLHKGVDLFVATNVTNFPRGTLNGTLTVGLSDSEECNTEAYDNALKFPLKVKGAYVVDALGMIEGANEYGWFNQTIRELDGNSTLPISLRELMNGWIELIRNGLTELMNGVSLDYGLTVYVLSAEEELLGCASMKIIDERTAAEYHKLVHGYSQEAIEEVSSSASKAGMFVFMSAIAAVGIAVV